MLLSVDHKDLIGMVGQRLKPSQVAQHNLKTDIVANRDHLEVHAGSDAVIGVRHGGPQLLSLLDGQALANPLDHIKGQLFGHGGQVIGVE